MFMADIYLAQYVCSFVDMSKILCYVCGTRARMLMYVYILADMYAYGWYYIFPLVVSMHMSSIVYIHAV